ncbi:MAG: tetratricopeptide repeat protein [Lachnospiraceae bacterium]|nr:tetratricopeptide repeat protein [Lachnospiraceae bacterium]
MVYFETGRELDVRLYKTAAVLIDAFRSCGKYIVQDDDLILLGGIESIALSPVNREARLEAPLRVFNVAKKKARLLRLESAAGKLVKMINDAYREWFEIDPFSNFMEFEGVLLDTNRAISEYGLYLVWNSQGMALFHDGEKITFEQGLQFIIDNDIYEDIGRNLAEWINDARFYKDLGQDDKAVRRYERVLRYLDSSSEVYTEVAFALGELYYFGSNYDEALSFYKRCNLEHVDDVQDFYIHIGHALIDRKMKNFESEIKIYYRSLLDSVFYDNNKRIVEYAASEIAQNYAEYEKVCLQIGKRYYDSDEGRIEGPSEDKGGLVVSEGSFVPAEVPVRPKKRYENIKLVKTKSLEIEADKDPESLLADGLYNLNEGEYQKAYENYALLAEKTGKGTVYYTWAMLQLAKLFSFFEEYENAVTCLADCERDKFGIVYRLEDYKFLYVHAKIVIDDFENDKRFRLMVRGKYDHYYARFDRQYHFLTRDRNLCEDFVRYEKECVENVLNQLP